MNSPERGRRKVVVGPNFLAHWFVYDYQTAGDQEELQKVMRYINYHGYDLISVTQNAAGIYTLFFRRRACG